MQGPLRRLVPVFFLLLASCAVPAREAKEESTPLSAGEAIPCAAQDVLQRVCQRCHGPEPSSGASISFVTLEDVHRKLNGKPTWLKMSEAIRRRIMPPETVVLTDADEVTLQQWLEMGAPARAPGETCP